MRPKRIEPGPGQESVWDYPRPPVLDRCDHHVVVRLGGEVVADCRRPIRVLETSQPPAYYLPVADVRTELLEPSPTTTFCEWKGIARYWSVRVGDRVALDAAWSYPDPTSRFVGLTGWYAFYAQKLSCEVDGEAVDANEGAFYGGWITSRVVGPFKGGAGSSWW